MRLRKYVPSVVTRFGDESAALSSGFDSLVLEPPPISGPARYFIVSGLRSGGWNSRWKRKME